MISQRTNDQTTENFPSSFSIETEQIELVPFTDLNRNITDFDLSSNIPTDTLGSSSEDEETDTLLFNESRETKRGRSSEGRKESRRSLMTTFEDMSQMRSYNRGDNFSQ